MLGAAYGRRQDKTGARSARQGRTQSVTDFPERVAPKAHPGRRDMHRFKSVVGDVVWGQWETVAAASAEDITSSVRRLETSYSAGETSRVDLTHALFHLGKRSDTEGSVRVAMIYKGTLGVAKAAKHYVDTGSSLEGSAISAEQAAVAAATTKDVNKRKRQAPAVQKSDQCNVRHTMLVAQLKIVGLEPDDGVEEQAFIERGPASVAKIMAMIGDMIQKRVVQTAQASPCSSSHGS